MIKRGRLQIATILFVALSILMSVSWNPQAFAEELEVNEQSSPGAQFIACDRTVTRYEAMASMLAVAEACGAVDDSWEPQPSIHDWFSDLDGPEQFVRGAAWVAENGITTGWIEKDGTYTFRGTSVVIRQDMAAFLYRTARAVGLPAADAVPSDADRGAFVDVDSWTPHASEIWWLSAVGYRGIAAEGGAREFRGSSAVTETDLAEFMWLVEPSASPVLDSVIEIETGQSLQLGATAPGELSYSSSDESVATVSADGTVRARSAGEATVTVTAAATQDAAAATRDFSVRVTDGEMSVAQVVLSDYAPRYTGEPQEPDCTVTYRGTRLVRDVDYTVSYSDNVEPGFATLTVTGIGDIKGTQSVSFEVLKANPNYTKIVAVRAGSSTSIEVTTDGTVSFSSSDESVATVSPDGTVRGITPGRADVTVEMTEGPHYAQLSVTVGVTVMDQVSSGTHLIVRDRPVTRYEAMASMFAVAEAYGMVADSWEPRATTLARYTDLDGPEQFVRAACWAIENDISSGWIEEDGTRTFHGTSVVVRQDMAAFLHRTARAVGLPIIAVTPSDADRGAFVDVASSTPHAEDIWWLSAAGYRGIAVEGGAREFRGMQGVTEAELAEFVRLVEPSASPVFDSLIVLEAGQSLKLGATAPGELSYSSSDESVATVSADGTIRARSAGEATVTVAAAATQDAAAATRDFRVKVTGRMVPTIEAHNIKAEVGEEVAIVASSNSTGGFRYRSTNASIAQVSEDGVVHAVAPGVVRIVITVEQDDSYFEATKNITVSIRETGVAEEESTNFSDTTVDTPHNSDVEWLAEQGISEGWVGDDGQIEFRPFNDIVRADMAAFLFRLAKNWGMVDDSYTPSQEVKNMFTDVSEETAHHNEIWWLAETGISKGWVENDGTKTFRPFTNIKRADMAAFIHRLANDAGKGALVGQGELEAQASEGAFIDVTAETAHHEHIEWLAASKISEGWKEEDGSRTFRPFTDVKRCDMAAFLQRLDALE